MTQGGAQPGLAILDLDPFSDESLNDPFTSYERIRDAGPVVSFERYQNDAVARHAEVQAVLKDWENFSCTLGGIGLGDIRKPQDADALIERAVAA